MSNFNKSKKVVDTSIEKIIRTDIDGAVVSEETNISNTIRIVEKEPPYMKLYLDDLALLRQLSKMENLILHEIFKITQYNTNRVILNKFYRDEISKKLDIKDQTIRNAISKLSKLDLLIKQGTGVYILNPHYFGIGDWSSLKGLRMTIEYTEQGKNISVSTIEKEKDTNLKIAK